MSKFFRTIVFAAAALLSPLPAFCQHVDDRISVDAADWPWWRGPERNGVANPKQDPPTEWSATQNVAWKATVPGRGHSSPAVVGPRVFRATADELQATQSVLCYDRETGNQLWQTIVHRGGLMQKNQKSTAASGTVACDGESVFINFANGGAVDVTALTLAGKQPLADWKIRRIYHSIKGTAHRQRCNCQSLVVAAADSHAGGVIAGLNRKTGRGRLETRPAEAAELHLANHLERGGSRPVAVDQRCDLVSSLTRSTATTLWEIKGATTECVTSTVTDGERVFSSGGYPKNHVAAILADGSGKVVWEKKERVYVPSMLERDGYLFSVLDAGVAACWKSDTGKEQWKHRISGVFSASPVLVGDLIYATNEVGETYVFRADPNKFEQVAMNKLGDQAMATATICYSRIYMRVVEQGDGKPLRNAVLSRETKVVQPALGYRATGLTAAASGIADRASVYVLSIRMTDKSGVNVQAQPNPLWEILG